MVVLYFDVCISSMFSQYLSIMHSREELTCSFSGLRRLLNLMDFFQDYSSLPIYLYLSIYICTSYKCDIKYIILLILHLNY